MFIIYSVMTLNDTLSPQYYYLSPKKSLTKGGFFFLQFKNKTIYYLFIYFYSVILNDLLFNPDLLHNMHNSPPK